MIHKHLGSSKTHTKRNFNYERMRHFTMIVFARSKMQFNIVRLNVRVRVFQLVNAASRLIGLLVYLASHS